MTKTPADKESIGQYCSNKRCAYHATTRHQLIVQSGPPQATCLLCGSKMITTSYTEMPAK